MLPGYAATTVTAVCDAHGMFLSVATGHPGASHDADALQASDIPGKLSTLPPGYYVVGDGGYGASTKMVIPFAHKVGRSSEVRRVASPERSSNVPSSLGYACCACTPVPSHVVPGQSVTSL